MNALLLSGNSLRNKDWIYLVKQAVAGNFDKTVVLDYDHWQSGSPLINLEAEEAKLAASKDNLGEFVVIAKSAGSLLATKSIYDGVLQPSKCIFMGVALAMVEREKLDFATWIKSVKCPVLFIHNVNDPVASSEKLKTYLQANPPADYKIVELPGDTHDYDDLDNINRLVKEFVFG